MHDTIRTDSTVHPSPDNHTNTANSDTRSILAEKSRLNAAKRTDAQREASRRNGALSHGPATPEGKARSSRNAVTHGLSSHLVVLFHEDRQAHAELRQAYCDDFLPRTLAELKLVEEMVAAQWRLNRLYAMETAALDLSANATVHLLGSDAFPAWDQRIRTSLAFTHAAAEPGNPLEIVYRHEPRLQRTYHRALAALQKLQSTRRKQEIELGIDPPPPLIDTVPATPPIPVHFGPLYIPPPGDHPPATQNPPNEPGKSLENRPKGAELTPKPTPLDPLNGNGPFNLPESVPPAPEWTKKDEKNSPERAQ